MDSMNDEGILFDIIYFLLNYNFLYLKKNWIILMELDF
jgi:hypothetical protein